MVSALTLFSISDFSTLKDGDPTKAAVLGLDIGTQLVGTTFFTSVLRVINRKRFTVVMINKVHVHSE